MQEIEFKAEIIRLKDLLKKTSMLASGGMAKNIIREEGIILNGKPCFIPGKKVTKGDQVIFDHYLIKIV
ncbi:MAG: RNA-binding S4 domain-containing protein [Peptoniphilaceae bacterium]|nr:RNA-binding S4 domain-containing protein [Peptoniphilaceae bacterium]MDY6018912.1 RNA-binding S4 domain-containing protein [Anaerococcus sp.]